MSARLLIALTVLALTPAAARASEMCDAVASVLAQAPDFTALRGTSDGDQSWKATLALPGGTDCTVDESDYACNFDLEGEGVEAPAATALTHSLLTCLPNSSRVVSNGRAYLTASGHIRMVLIWFREIDPHYYLIVQGSV